MSVVIPTRDRPQDLRRCLRALESQSVDRPFEVIVVNDGTEGVPDRLLIDSPLRTRVVEGPRRGPAAARNAGWRQSSAPIIVFTDDDTVPARDWLRGAAGLLAADDGVIGIEGPTRSEPFDRLTEHSVQADGPGAWLTCNIAYRRWALQAVDGFFEAFPSAHCEDLDIGLRMRRIGAMAFSEEMVVEHVVRPIAIKRQVLNGRLVASETVLFRRHPDHYAAELRKRPVPRAVISRLRWWLSYLKRSDKSRLAASPALLGRWVVGCLGQTMIAALTARRFAANPRPELGVRAD